MKALLRHLWRGIIAQLLIRPSLALMGATAVALSIASGVTTFYGMYAFTRQWLLCLLVTFGIQVLMLVLAWRIGDVYATSVHRGASATPITPYWGPFAWLAGLYSHVRRSFIIRNLLLIASFMVCLAISVFFSFDSLYSTISPPDQRKVAAEVTARTAVQQISADIAISLENRQNKLAADLTTGADWQTFEKRIVGVIQVATDPNVEKRRQERERERIGQIEAERQRANTAAADRERLTRERQRLGAELQRIVGDRVALEAKVRESDERITAKKQEVDAKRAQREEERRTGRGEAQKGEGPRFRALGVELDKLEAQLKELQAAARAPAEELSRVDTRRKAVEAELKLVEDSLAKASSIAAPEPAPSPANGTPTDKISQVAPASTDEAVASAKTLDRALANLRDRHTQQEWEIVVSQCGAIVQLLANTPDFRERARDLDCSPPPATLAVASELFSVESRRADLNRTCLVDLGGKSFLEIVNHGNNCLQTARLPSSETVPFQRRLDLVRIEQDENAHTFAKTLAAFDRGDKLAYLAAMIAVAIDGLVFITGIWGARASVSHLTRGGEETAGEIDEHADLMMRIETRPEQLRPPGGWAEPAEVYKARLFIRRFMPYHSPDHPHIVGTISLEGLKEIERDAIKSVLTIGPFAFPEGNELEADYWFVTDRLLRYVTKIAADHDRIKRFRGATSDLETARSDRGDAAQARDRRRTRSDEDDLAKEQEFTNRGFRNFRNADHGATRDSTAGNGPARRFVNVKEGR